MTTQKGNRVSAERQEEKLGDEAQTANSEANEQGLAASAVREAQEAIRAIFKLLDDNDLVRNIERDDDKTFFIQQGLRIRSALLKCQQILDSPVSEREKPNAVSVQPKANEPVSAARGAVKGGKEDYE